MQTVGGKHRLLRENLQASLAPFIWPYQTITMYNKVNRGEATEQNSVRKCCLSKLDVLNLRIQCLELKLENNSNRLQAVST